MKWPWTVASCEHCQVTEDASIKVRDENIRLRHQIAEMKDAHADDHRKKDAEFQGRLAAHLREQAAMHESEIKRHQVEILALRAQIAKLK